MTHKPEEIYFQASRFAKHDSIMHSFYMSAEVKLWVLHAYLKHEQQTGRVIPNNGKTDRQTDKQKYRQKIRTDAKVD